MTSSITAGSSPNSVRAICTATNRDSWPGTARNARAPVPGNSVFPLLRIELFRRDDDAEPFRVADHRKLHRNTNRISAEVPVQLVDAGDGVRAEGNDHVAFTQTGAR